MYGQRGLITLYICMYFVIMVKIPNLLSNFFAQTIHSEHTTQHFVSCKLLESVVEASWHTVYSARLLNARIVQKTQHTAHHLGTKSFLRDLK